MNVRVGVCFLCVVRLLLLVVSLLDRMSVLCVCVFGCLSTWKFVWSVVCLCVVIVCLSGCSLVCVCVVAILFGSVCCLRVRVFDCLLVCLRWPLGCLIARLFVWLRVCSLFYVFSACLIVCVWWREWLLAHVSVCIEWFGVACGCVGVCLRGWLLY